MIGSSPRPPIRVKWSQRWSRAACWSSSAESPVVTVVMSVIVPQHGARRQHVNARLRDDHVLLEAGAADAVLREEGLDPERRVRLEDLVRRRDLEADVRALEEEPAPVADDRELLGRLVL